MSRYAYEVVAGKRPAAKRQVQACQRHLRDLKRQKTPAFPFYFDADVAQANIDFFQYCHHTKGEWAGLPIKLAPFQEFTVGCQFGWLRVSDSRRRFSLMYEQMPRKHGKSTKHGGIAIKLAFFDGEDGAEVYCYATKKDQARIVFGDARAMVLRSPELRGRIGVLVNNLHVEAKRQKLEPLGADEDSLDGLNVSAAIGDEFHAQKTRAMFDVINTAMGSRRQPTHALITTPGYDRQSVCFELFQYACSVLDGSLVDETFFAFIADMDEDDDWESPRTWAKANPGLGQVGQWFWEGVSVADVQARIRTERARLIAAYDGDAVAVDRELAQWIGGSVKLDEFLRLAAQARISPASLNTFLRLQLGKWTEQSVRAIPMDQWDRCAGDRSWHLLKDVSGRRIRAVGVDLSSTRDIAAVAYLLEAEDVPGALDLVVDAFIPENRVESRKERARIKALIEAGALTETSGDTIDYDFIRKRIRERREEAAECGAIGYDPWNATQFAIKLRDEDGFQVVEVRQGTSTLHAPTTRLLDLIASQKVRHGGDPLLRWCAMNFTTKVDSNNNIMPDKSAAADKIDPIVAAVDALAVLEVAPAVAGKKKSPYATRTVPGIVTANGVTPIAPRHPLDQLAETPEGEPR